MNLDSNDKFIGHTDTRFNAENDRSLDLDKCKLYWPGGGLPNKGRYGCAGPGIRYFRGQFLPGH